MKYIRTKDDFIYKITARDFGIFAVDEKGELVGRIDSDEIIKQANTIEELCDVFVFVYKNKPNINHKIKEHLISIEDNNVYFVDSMVIRSVDDSLLIGIIYGAIWTDKGLIYIAKMNDKGEMELL